MPAADFLRDLRGNSNFEIADESFTKIYSVAVRAISVRVSASDGATNTRFK